MIDITRIRDRFSTDDHQQRHNVLSVLFLSPAVFFLGLLGLIPVVYTIYLSITDQTLFASTSNFVGLENYLSLFSDSLFRESIVRGIVFAVGSTTFQILLGLGLALTLNKTFRGASLARTFAIFPYLVPTIAVALMWQWMLSSSYGIVNTWAISLGLIESAIPFFGDSRYAMWSVIFANSWKFTSFAFIIFISRLQAIDDDLYDQAKVLGASTWQQFRDITLPSLWSAILLVVFIRTIWMFNRFDIVWLLTGGGPSDATTTIPVYIYRVAFNQYNLALGSAAAIMLFLALSVFSVFYFKIFRPSEGIDTR